MIEARFITVYPRVVPEHLLEEEPWRKELRELLLEYVSLALFPTPYGLRQVAEVLLELREIMLVDGLDYGLTGEAMDRIRRWVEEAKRGQTFDLGGLLRDLRSFAERLDEGWIKDECSG